MNLFNESIQALGSGQGAGPSKLVNFRAALAEVIAEWQPLETTLTRALNALVASMPGSSPAFFRFSENRLFCLSSPQYPPGLSAAMQGLSVPRQDLCGPGEAPFWSFEPKAVDVRIDENWTLLRPLLASHGLAGCWSWPVFSPSGEALGIVVIFSVESRPPDDDETELLSCAERILALLLEQRLLIDDLRYQAEHDALTCALNSTTFQKLLEHELYQARPTQRKISLVCLHVDRIRSVNDLLGRTVGDRLLKEIASRVASTLNSEDSLARTDGNEFVALLRDSDQADGALRTAARIDALVRTPFLVGESEIQLRASIGLASFPDHAADARSLLQAAQSTVQRIKNSGGNRVEVCDPKVDYADVNRARLESELHKAVDRGELLLYYQPKIYLASGALDGAEALMRWQSAELGLISPAAFIPLAEETGEIVQLGYWAILEACRQVDRWHLAPSMPQRVAVNVSPVQLAHTRTLNQLRAAIEAIGTDPSRIELEITESTFAGDFSRIRDGLQVLRQLGVMITLDDFGTGYSSLSVLRELPFDTLKIDKSFLDAAEAGSGSINSKSRRMLVRMIDMGHDLGKNVVVEGVETQAQVDLLLEIKCDVAQGYFFGRPIPAAAWEEEAHALAGCAADGEAKHKVSRD